MNERRASNRFLLLFVALAGCGGENHVRVDGVFAADRLVDDRVELGVHVRCVTHYERRCRPAPVRATWCVNPTDAQLGCLAATAQTGSGVAYTLQLDDEEEVSLSLSSLLPVPPMSGLRFSVEVRGADECGVFGCDVASEEALTLPSP